MLCWVRSTIVWDRSKRKLSFCVYIYAFNVPISISSILHRYISLCLRHLNIAMDLDPKEASSLKVSTNELIN